MRRTQYDIDSDQRISGVRFALTNLDRGEGGNKAETERYSYGDLVAAILNPALVGEMEGARDEWVDLITVTLHEAIHTDGITAGEALASLGQVLTSAGNRIVQDERAAQRDKTP